MTHDLTVHDVLQVIIRVHTLEENEKVCCTGLTDVKMIPASVHTEAGRHTAWRWRTECVKAAVCVWSAVICSDLFLGVFVRLLMPWQDR